MLHVNDVLPQTILPTQLKGARQVIDLNGVAILIYSTPISTNETECIVLSGPLQYYETHVHLEKEAALLDSTNSYDCLLTLVQGWLDWEN